MCWRGVHAHWQEARERQEVYYAREAWRSRDDAVLLLSLGLLQVAHARRHATLRGGEVLLELVCAEGEDRRSNQDQPAEASPARANLTKPPD